MEGGGGGRRVSRGIMGGEESERGVEWERVRRSFEGRGGEVEEDVRG